MTLATAWAAIQRLVVERLEPQRDPFRQHVLAVHAQAEARHRDADLGGGDVAVLPLRVLEDAQPPAAASRLPCAGLVLDARARRADDGELGRHEQPVGDDQQEDDAERERGAPSLVLVRLVRRRRGAPAPIRPRDRRRARPRTRSRRRSRVSPGTGRRPSAAVTSPPTVVASVSHSVFEQRRRIVNGHATRAARMLPVRQRLGDRIAGLELVADVAEQLRQHVLERQQSGGAAELVDDERLVRAALAQLAQHAVRGHALVDAGDRPQQAGQRRRRARRSPASGRGPWCGACRRCCRSSRDRPAAAKTGSARRWRSTSSSGVLMSSAEILPPRHHELLGLPQVEPQRALQAAVLVGFEQAAVAALGDQQLDLVGRVDVTVRLRRRRRAAAAAAGRCRSAT